MKIQTISTLNQNRYSFNAKLHCKQKIYKDVFVQQPIDIGSNQEYPAGILSNFTESLFILDGKQINSMEGFLQALKTDNPKEQEDVCKLIGYQAKKMSHKFKKRPGFTLEKIHWNGKEYDRNSKEFQKLLIRAFEAKYDCDKEFRNALTATKTRKLTHSFGKSSTKETILTEEEFIKILEYLRSTYKRKYTILKLFGFKK